MVLSHRPKQNVGALASLLRLSLRRTVPLDCEPVGCERLKGQVLNILHRSLYRNVSILSQAAFSTQYGSLLSRINSLRLGFETPITKSASHRFEKTNEERWQELAKWPAKTSVQP